MRGGLDTPGNRMNAHLLFHSDGQADLYCYLHQDVGVNPIHPNSQTARAYGVKLGIERTQMLADGRKFESFSTSLPTM